MPTKLTQLLCYTSLLLASTLHASAQSNSGEKFFSLKEIKNAEAKEPAPINYIKSTDGITLAVRKYAPTKAEAVLVFYHGGGAHSGLSYQYIGAGLRDDFNVAVYTPDIRGHGYSGGERGDAPNKEDVWKDINTVIDHARSQHPNLPLYVGGHSSGAGLALNYSSWSKRQTVAGFIFIAPYFGYKSKTEFDKSPDRFEFTTVNTADFVKNAMSGGRLKAHAKAVVFNYPASVLAANAKIVPFNTVTMSHALTPSSPRSQLRKLDTFGLWIGTKDEAFDPVKVIKFSNKSSANTANKTINMLDDENHFSILLTAPSLIGNWINTKGE